MTSVIDTFSNMFENLLTSIHTCMPGQVVTYDSTRQVVSVQPVFMRKYYDSEVPTPLPIIDDVPIVFTGSGDKWIIVDIIPGDYVLLLFSERAISDWLVSGGVIDPRRNRKFHLSDAIAIPCLNPFSSPIVSSISPGSIGIVSKTGTVHIEVKSTGRVYINGNMTIDQ